LLNEPSAAAVAYGLYRTSTDLPNAEQPPRHVALVDFGSSALQIPILAFQERQIEGIHCYCYNFILKHCALKVL
jgi:molecular chaperone DnaK (HSP70)